MNRRTAMGTLSEIFGERTLELDEFMRSLGFNEYSRRSKEYIEKNSEYKNLLKAFVSGINYFGNNFKLPIEYYIIGSKFYNYTIEDIVGTISMLSLAMNEDYGMEVLYQYLEQGVGKEFADMVFLFRNKDFPFWNHTTIKDDELLQIGLIKKNYDKNNNNEQKNFINENEKFMKSESKINNLNEKVSETIIGNKFQTIGASNCWNVAGKFTSSGKPLLCNDPHLPNGMPGMFYIVKLYLPDGNIISGASLPGTPIFITGSNNFISWGITIENSDNTDFCGEKIIDNKYYVKDNQTYPLKKVKEYIKIKNKKDPIIYEVNYTPNGPIFGTTVPGIFTTLHQDYTHPLPLSLRLAFFRYNFTAFDFLFKVNLGKKSSDFLPYKHLGILPNYNLHWVTKNGEIGWAVEGLIDVKNYQNRICRGYSSDDDIEKVIPNNELLMLKSPKRGFIVSANNKPATEKYLYPLLGNHNNARAHRIEEMIQNFINQEKKISVKEAIEILNDVKDSNAEYILPLYLDIIKRNIDENSLKNNKIYMMLKNWNYEMSFDSKEATIYATLERELGLNLLMNNSKNKEKLDKTSANAIMNYLNYWNFIFGIIEKIYQKEEKIYLPQCKDKDSKNNQNDESDCEKYLVKIFIDLEKSLQKFKDKNGNIKKWGELNFNDFPHTPFDDIPVLNKIFSRKQFVGGNRNTVKIVRGPANSEKGEYIGTQSPRLKFVCDMIEPNSPYLTVSGGNGGNPLNKFYNNFFDRHEKAKLVKFENIDFNNEKLNDRMIILEKN